MTIKEKTIQDEKDRTITLKGTLKFEEFLPKRKVIAYQTLYVIVVLILVSITIYYVFGSHLYLLLEYPIVIPVLILASLLIIIFGTWCYGKKVPRIMKKKFEASNMINEQIFTINSKTITRDIDENCLYLNWSDVVRFKEYNDAFNVYFWIKTKSSDLPDNLNLKGIERHSNVYIPKRFFQNQSDIIYFKKLVLKNIQLNRSH